MRAVRRISLVVPMYNESGHVAQLVDDIAAQDFAGEVELLVADGASTDDCVERLEAAARARGLALTVLENPARWVSHGLNACIRRASGDLIVRLDCHSRYPSDYLRRCAVAAEETDAMNVGGLFEPVGRTPTERAVATALRSAFGGVHWTKDGGSTDRTEADTVPYGAFRPEAFELAGLFDETLVRDQDDEFNFRLRRRGGRILLDPTIKVYYCPRGTLRGVFRQYYEYGLWKVPVMLKHREVISGRSLVPFAFVASLALLAPAAVASRAGRRLAAAEVAAYASCAVAFGTASAVRDGEVALLPRVVAVYPAFHVGHGAGMLHGWLRAGARRLRRA